MKEIKNLIKMLIIAIGLLTSLSGCTLFGLDIQKDYDRTPHTLDPHIYMNAWDYMKKRSTAGDATFTKMMDAITYAGIDSMEYKKEGRTFILLNDAASKDVWAKLRTSTNKAGTKWSDFPVQNVKNYLLYLILQGVYDHYTLPPIENVEVKTLAPPGIYNTQGAAPSATDPFFIPSFVQNSNPNSTMLIQVFNGNPSNTSDYPIRLNTVTDVRTSSILATNGTIHVINGFLTPVQPLK